MDYEDDYRIVAIEMFDVSENATDPSALLYGIEGHAALIAA